MSQCQHLPPDGNVIVRALPGVHSRVLLVGAMGSGKSTLAAGLARAAGGEVYGIGADPGSPAFGVPGAVSLGVWSDGGWQCRQSMPLCSLDAARFRLPLVEGVARLANTVRDRMLIVDAPGLVRGVAAAELLHGLVLAAGIDAVVVLDGAGTAGLAGELAALACEILPVRPADAARRPPRHQRERTRTRLWDEFLEAAAVHPLSLDALAITGTPPPLAAPDAWRGRQIALLAGTRTVAIGEIVEVNGAWVTARLSNDPGAADTLLIRDAARNAAAMLVTAPSIGAPPARPRNAAGREPDPVRLSVDGVGVRLVNGVLGDPLVELEVPNSTGVLLFDLGDAAALPVKTLHNVTDVFVSHAHIDHIGGFPALLRARLSGELPPCRIYGPPGMRDHIAGFVAGIRWDRIGDAGPVFLVAELCAGATVRWARIQPGREAEDLGSEPVADDVLLDTGRFRVRAAVLDHGIPVLAFLLELADTLHVRSDVVARHGLQPGPWLGELKRRVAAGEPDAPVMTPLGRRMAADLARSVLRLESGTRIAYATDLADTTANRQRLAALARGADLLVCEAAFLVEDARQAMSTGHLTVPGCVAIAHEAGVARLLPFHFSRRYRRRLDDVHRALIDARRATGMAGELVGPI